MGTRQERASYSNEVLVEKLHQLCANRASGASGDAADVLMSHSPSYLCRPRRQGRGRGRRPMSSDMEETAETDDELDDAASEMPSYRRSRHRPQRITTMRPSTVEKLSRFLEHGQMRTLRYTAEPQPQDSPPKPPNAAEQEQHVATGDRRQSDEAGQPTVSPALPEPYLNECENSKAEPKRNKGFIEFVIIVLQLFELLLTHTVKVVGLVKGGLEMAVVSCWRVLSPMFWRAAGTQTPRFQRSLALLGSLMAIPCLVGLVLTYGAVCLLVGALRLLLEELCGGRPMVWLNSFR